MPSAQLSTGLLPRPIPANDRKRRPFFFASSGEGTGVARPPACEAPRDGHDCMGRCSSHGSRRWGDFTRRVMGPILAQLSAQPQSGTWITNAKLNDVEQIVSLRPADRQLPPSWQDVFAIEE